MILSVAEPAVLGAIVGLILALTGAGGGILAVPLLVFGAGSLAPGGETGMALTGAVSLVLLAIAPFATGAAVRAARS
jgi:heme exporter protein B